MSVSISHSSSLRILKRCRSKSSVSSSSDTNVDSAGYASSFETTTPEDDAQTFHLGLDYMIPNVQDANQKHAPREKLTIATKYRSFSSAMRKVKKAAHALTTFKKKRPDDISPILISSPLRERFGKRMSVKSHPDENFYSLPNRRFSLSDVRIQSHHSRAITRKFGTISGPVSNFARGTSRQQRSGLRMPSFSESRLSALSSPTSTRTVPETRNDVLTFRVVLLQAIRVTLFVPWCAAVGGALLLFPSYIELVAFRPGYLPSPKGIQRFAYWAECGQQHVMIFLACLATVLWYNYALGLSLTIIAVSRFVFVWHAFKVDKSIPLGEDDQESLYLVVTGLASVDGSFRFSVREPRDGQIATGTDHSA